MGISASIGITDEDKIVILHTFRGAILRNDVSDLELFDSVKTEIFDREKNAKHIRSVICCDVINFEDAVENIFKAGRTPIISDISSDNKICTFFSYQPDVVLFDAEKMLQNSLTQPLSFVIEDARKHLVNIVA